MQWLTESEIQATLPESIARENLCVPILRIGSTLLIATSNPDAESLSEKLRFVLDQPIRMIARNTHWIQSKIDAVYSIHRGLSDEPQPSASMSYWAQCARHDGSSLFVAASGVSATPQSYSHWSGEIEFSIDHPDRDFWDWLVTIQSFKRMLTERDLVAIRRIWQRSMRRAKKN
jgi:hypothetical protein